MLTWGFWGSWLSFPSRQDTRSSAFNVNKTLLERQGLASSRWVKCLKGELTQSSCVSRVTVQVQETEAGGW